MTGQQPTPRASDPPGSLDDLVDAVLGHRPRPLRWQGLDADQAAAAWAALDRWVRWLVRRYTLDHRDVPACWASHGDLFEELSALHTAHLAAYDPAASPTGPAEWHHTLASTRTRLQAWAARTGCRHHQHRPARPPDWASEPPPNDYTAALDAVVHADLADRA